MNDIYIVFSSVTYALRAMSLLEKVGISSRLEKIKDLSALSGCGYALAIKSESQATAIKAIYENGIKIIQILQSKDGAL